MATPQFTKKELNDLQKSNPSLFTKLTQLITTHKQQTQQLKHIHKEKLQQQKLQRKLLERQTAKEWKTNEREFRNQQKEQEKQQRRNEPKGLHLQLKKTMYNGNMKLYTIKNTRYKKVDKFLNATKPIVLKEFQFPRKIQTTFLLQFSKDGVLLDPHYFKRNLEIWPNADSLSDRWSDMITDFFQKEIFNFEGRGSGLVLSKILALDFMVYNYLDLDADNSFRFRYVDSE